MNEQQAIALVQKTFKSAFDRSGYIRFLKNLLNEFDEEGARSNQGARIPEKFQNYVEKLERVGKYKADDGEVLLFIVYLKNDTSIERARTMQRNFIAHYLQMDMKDAALVAFVSKDPANWRFSFIKMEYRYDEEKNKIKEEFTPAKRWSFLVGVNEASHTAQRKLVPLMADDEHNPTLADLEDAFNIEKVTKEFFEKYRGLFIRTKEALDEAVSADPKLRREFESKGIDTVNFSKKLLGQIIFLYYLQKKGWFGVARDAAWGEGSRTFLRELFDKKHGDYKNFFNDILEPLFYKVLRRDRSKDDHYYLKFNCKIPFLNGGLFDPMNNYDWVNIDILLPNELFHNQTKTKEGDEGDGILDIFDRYNFTVKEDEPFEKEVAIDPELLGKAYEKFNAIRPDNYDEFLKALKSGKKGDESKFNKQYGVYYTPREIVHYMCQQSLINYLYAEVSSDEGLGNQELGIRNYPSKDDFATLILKGEQIKEHDERVAAKGRETATYSFQMPESIRAHADLIDEKLANIKVCDPAVGSGAFPVGMMSEIVRARDVLRSWTKTKKTLYAFKRECIENSLYGVDIDPGAVEIAKLRLWLSLVVDEDDIQNIKPLPNLDYKIVQGNSLIGVEKNLFNNHLFTELETLKPLYFNATNISKKKEYKTKIDGLIDQITDGRAQFDFEIYFSEVFHEKGGFDVVIANPPYLNFKMYSAKDRLVLKSNYDEIFDGKADYYYYFFVKAHSISNGTGHISLITSRYWLEAEFAMKLRRFLSRKSRLSEIIDFQNITVFEGIGIKTAITSYKKATPNKYSFDYRRPVDKLSELDLLKFMHQKIDGDNLLDDKWRLGDNSFFATLEKIEKDAVPLSEIAKCNQGIVTGLDKAFITTENEFNGIPKSLVKTWVKVGDIHKYFILPVEKRELVYTNLIKDIDEYPILKKRLLKFKPKLSNRREVKNGRIRWFDLQWGRDQSIFDSEKLICRFKAEKNTFCLDTEGYYSSADTTVVTLNKEGKKLVSLKYVLALVNSKLLDYYFKSYGKLMDYRYEYYPTPVGMLRIKISDEQEKFVKLVDRILAAKAKNPQADTSPLEKEIDELVYQLYGLSPDEIAIVEGKG